VELSAKNRRALYIPEEFAHGFLTVTDNTEVFYQMSEFFHPECAKGVRWNDPAFAIDWISVPQIISRHDSEYENFLK
jgi:dTDP-4-dehydrorhamnose 3,5-epimerase